VKGFSIICIRVRECVRIEKCSSGALRVSMSVAREFLLFSHNRIAVHRWTRLTRRPRPRKFRRKFHDDVVETDACSRKAIFEFNNDSSSMECVVPERVSRLLGTIPTFLLRNKSFSLVSSFSK